MSDPSDEAKRIADEKAKAEAEKKAAERLAKETEAKRAADEKALRDRVAQLEAELAAKTAADAPPANPNGTITLNAKNERVEG